MENKTITKEQAEMLFKATHSLFGLSRDFGRILPDGHNIFRDQFAGMRQAVDIIGLSEEYLRYVAEKEQK